MSTPTDPTGNDDVAQLRRRLYQPSASADDVQRYRAAAATIAPPPPVVSAAPVRPDRRKRAVRVAIPGAVAAATLLLGAIVATSTPKSSATSTTSTPDPVSTVGLAQNRTGPQPYSFQIAESTQPLSLATTITAAGVSFSGIGPGTIPIDQVGLSGHGGVIRVQMLTDTSDAVGWQLHRVATRADYSSYDQTLARGRAGQEMAPVSPVDIAYAGDPPATMRVSAAVGTRWWLDLRLAPRSR